MALEKLITVYLEPGNTTIASPQLLYRYFVQLMPDGKHLVPGVLHQGLPPENGQWLEIGKIERPLAKRYFVKLTPRRTLVPGSLITATEHPGEWWREV